MERIIQAALALASFVAITGCGGGGNSYNIDAGPGTDTDTDADTDVDSDVDSDSDTDSDTDTDVDTDSDTDTDTDSDSDTDSDTDTDTDSDTDTDTDTDTDSDSDTGSDTETDTFVALCSGEGVWLDEGWWFDFLPDYPGGDLTWPGTRCWQDPPAPTTMNWDDAMTYCDGLELAGYDDWTLPTINHLRFLGRPNTVECASCGLIDPGDLAELDTVDCEPCIPVFGGPGAGGCYWPAELAEIGCDTPAYWSSSESWNNPDWKAWVWLFSGNYPGAASSIDGTVPAWWKSNPAAVRCVRVLE